MIDLDEFERRLSRSPSPARNDDPLAELARLVGGGEDRFESMFQARPTRSRAPEPQQPDEPHHVPDWLVEESHQHAQPKGRAIDFAAIEAGLRGSLDPEFQNFADAEDRRWHDHHRTVITRRIIISKTNTRTTTMHMIPMHMISMSRKITPVKKLGSMHPFSARGADCRAALPDAALRNGRNHRGGDVGNRRDLRDETDAGCAGADRPDHGPYHAYESRRC